MKGTYLEFSALCYPGSPERARSTTTMPMKVGSAGPSCATQAVELRHIEDTVLVAC